jgi:adenylate cyclase
VACAVAVQKAVREHQAGTPADARVVFRIGVNLGDVVIEGDGDLLGDGVNVAGRLEQLCEPGGVLVSGTAYDQLQGKLPYPLDNVGERRLKNIERPVRVYAVRAALQDRSSACGSSDPKPTLSNKPSIAVLPFTNLSGNPQQQGLADGITGDVITDLSRFRDLDVIARHSSFTRRVDAVDLRRIGQELGVQYMLSGSLQRQGDSVRVSAWLVDVATGVHVWSERWERSAADVFAGRPRSPSEPPTCWPATA